MARDAAQPDRVAVGLRFRKDIDAEIAAGTAAILDHPLLARQRAHLAAQNARERIGRPTGGKRIDVADGAARILPCSTDNRRGGDRAGNARHDAAPAQVVSALHDRLIPGSFKEISRPWSSLPADCRSADGNF
jgi:hypothetical protein